jgi:hypothetical protein
MHTIESNPGPQPTNLRTGWEGHRTTTAVDLAGRSFAVTGESGGTVAITIGADSADWSWTYPDGVLAVAGAWVDVQRVRDDVLWIDTIDPESKTSLSLVINDAGQAIIYRARVSERDGAANMISSYEPGLVDAVAAAGTELFAESRDLIGKRAIVAYEDDHILEHVYFSTTVFGWQLLKGKNRAGGAQADLSVTYKLADDLYFIGWVEFRPVTAGLVMDYAAMRNVGKIFAWDDLGLTNEPAGATILSYGETIDYPADAMPV